VSRPAPVVLVDARNVLRSTWPNIPEQQLVELCREWASTQSCRVVVVFDGTARGCDDDERVELVSTRSESADDWIARQAARLRASGARFWLVTSDRELRARAGTGAERTIGGGTLARALLDLHT
jgi:predicted RNA-binding protein with PIN domain